MVRKLPRPQTNVHHLTVAPAMIDRVIGEAQVKCESPETCPANVAMIIIKEKSGLSQCTGFLIGPQTLMTNSHCLPKELRTSGASCADLTAVFASVDGQNTGERVPCEKVEFASTIASDEGSRLAVDLERRNRPQADFAILHLKNPTSRPPLPLGDEGLQDKEALTALTIDPVSDVNPGGTLRRKNCTAVAGSVLAPDFTGKNAGRFAPVAALSDCEILHGNSGSPLVDEQGRVRAVLFATLPSRQTKEQNFKAMSLATNLACLDPQSPTKDKCKLPKRPETTGPVLDRSTAAQLKIDLRNWARKEGAELSRLGPLSLKSADDEETDLVWGEPRCLKNKLESQLVIRAAPVWRVHFAVNEIYQPQVSILARGQMTLTMSPAPLESSQPTAAKLGQKLNIEHQVVFEEKSPLPAAFESPKTVELPICRTQSGAPDHSVD